LANNKTLSPEERLKNALNASELSSKTNQDSTVLNSNRILAYSYLINSEFERFAMVSRDNLDRAFQLNDSSAIAFTSKNLGWYNYAIEGDNLKAYDFYLTAHKYFDALNNLQMKAIALSSIATIQYDEKDYLGCEENAIEVLNILNTLQNQTGEALYEDEYICFNLLGVVTLKLENYEQSIKYHQQAAGLTKYLSEKDMLSLQTENNLAITYRADGNLKKALAIYENMLERAEILREDPSFYALVIINFNTTKFMTGDYDFRELETEFLNIYKMSDSIDDRYTRLSAAIDVAKFYLANDKKQLAIPFAKESYTISKDIPMNELYLESMLLLARLTNGEDSQSYLEEHIQLSDSLLKIERSVRNKFARIRYETDKIEDENQRMSQQRIWLSIVSITLLLALFLLYIVVNQRAKNKQLKFEKDQQKANEEIYNLMLSQQDKVDEARANEKKRISQDIHDGILGRLFGTRLSLDSLNFSEGKEAIRSRANYIVELKGIEEDIRKISHDLNSDFISGSNFMTIVSELIEKQSKAYKLECLFDFSDAVDWESISNKTKINIYRIIQESLQNIYKHAEATRVEIRFTLESKSVGLQISDNGKGFDVKKSKKGIGLKNIKSRVSELKGSLRFDADIGKGTNVIINIPYKS
jgi:signal transduction histidine kinase